MKSDYSSVLSQYKSKFSQYLINKVGYYDGQLYQFKRDGDNFTFVQANDKFSPYFLIVSSQYYSESSRSFPNVGNSELKKLLKHNLATDEIAIIQHTTEQKVELNVWCFDIKVPSSFVRIPETVLLSEILEPNQVVQYFIDNGERPLSRYLAKVNSVITATDHNYLINSFERFCTSIGSAVKNNKTIEASNLANTLINALKRINKLKLLPFTAKRNHNGSVLAIKKLLFPIALIGCLYLALSSGYLLIKDSYLTWELDGIKSEASAILNKDVLLTRKVDNYQTVLSVYNSDINANDIWEVLAPVIKVSNLSNIELDNSLVLVRGYTESASEVLELIVKHEKVLSAKFDSPIRKSKGREQFNISFELKNARQLNALVEID